MRDCNLLYFIAEPGAMTCSRAQPLVAASSDLFLLGGSATMRHPANSVRSTECRYSRWSGALMREVSVVPVHGAMHVSAECRQIMRYKRCSLGVMVSGTAAQCSDVTCTASCASCGFGFTSSMTTTSSLSAGLISFFRFITMRFFLSGCVSSLGSESISEGGHPLLYCSPHFSVM